VVISENKPKIPKKPQNTPKPTRSPPRPKKPPIPTGAIKAILNHAKNTCKAQRRKGRPWIPMEGAVEDVEKWLKGVL
jgi:hypothetical protein